MLAGDEFDLERAEWRIPAERMKMRSEHIVPLSRQALAVLDELRQVTGHCELLFPSERNLTDNEREHLELCHGADGLQRGLPAHTGSGRWLPSQ